MSQQCVILMDHTHCQSIHTVSEWPETPQGWKHYTLACVEKPQNIKSLVKLGVNTFFFSGFIGNEAYIQPLVSDDKILISSVCLQMHTRLQQIKHFIRQSFIVGWLSQKTGCHCILVLNYIRNKQNVVHGLADIAKKAVAKTNTLLLIYKINLCNLIATHSSYKTLHC